MPRITVARWLLVSLLSVLSVPFYAQDNTYPTPKRLFRIERNKNRNLVCYDANITDGQLNLKDPLKIYWVNREKEPGKITNLSMIQRKLAYGYKLISASGESCKITLSAYPGRELTLTKQGADYVCLIEINKKPAVLQSLYVKAKESNFMTVEYVELRGISLDSKQPISERVNNK